MRNALWMIPALLALLGVSNAAGAVTRHAGVTRFPEGTWVVLVGRVTSDPKGTMDEQKMQVGIGPKKVDYTLHLSTSIMKTLRGGKLDEDNLENGKWVRAEGRIMDDSRRIKVNRLRVIGKKTWKSLAGTPWNRAGFSRGYIQQLR